MSDDIIVKAGNHTIEKHTIYELTRENNELSDKLNEAIRALRFLRNCKSSLSVSAQDLVKQTLSKLTSTS